MLQRAASNAYSWWWASHIRTKQSKWLEQNLQDMGDKVQDVLQLIQEDGDSFAKRAEMYYKKRPELINFVEESYRAYRALAERYDHISTELQNANNTIASVFPEQVQFAMDEDDETPTSKPQKRPPQAQNIPKIPDVPANNIKGLLKSTVKKLRSNKPAAGNDASSTKSGLTNDEALAEIDKLQKGILSMQTEKEFAKVSYESSREKYREIETKINEIHEKICRLQDEFAICSVIEDDEARALMADAALKSCKQTLSDLYEKRERSEEEANVENQRIVDAMGKLECFKDRYERKIESERDDESVISHFTVVEMADKVDDLVTNVVSLESSVSSQTALIKRLRIENDELQSHIQGLGDLNGNEDDDPDTLNNKLREMEVKLHGVHDLNREVADRNNKLQTHLTKVHGNLDHLTEKISVKESFGKQEEEAKSHEPIEPLEHAENDPIEKNQSGASESDVQINELKICNAKKDEEIRSLRQNLNNVSMLLEKSLNENKDSNEIPTHSNIAEDDDIKAILMDRLTAASAIEEKFRMNIDELLEHNLDFWLRFSTSFHEIQKFQTEIEDLQSEESKLKIKLESQFPEPSLKSDARPIYKHLREIQTELTVWIEQSIVLKEELQCRFYALCKIQEEISEALKDGYSEDQNRLTHYQAAKFQGEVMNMQQENNKVAGELQAGLDHITGLQIEVDKTLAKLNDVFQLSGSKHQNNTQLRHSTSGSQVPLRSFIFGAKPKKHKPSIFACVNPVLQRKYHGLRAGLPISSKSSSRKKD